MAASERDEAARVAWREAIATKDPRQFVFVDETSTTIALTRLYGWAPHSERAIGSAPRNHGKNTTLVAALTPYGMQAPWAIDGAMNTRAFERYVTEVLGPTLQPGQVVILDNLSVHKARVIRHAIAARPCEVVFLPAYSPDYTPIELAFSKRKALIRAIGARTREALLDALQTALDAITLEDAHGWFAHMGYSLPASSP